MMPHHLLLSGFLNNHKEKIFLSLTSPLFLYFSIQEEIFKHSLTYKKSPLPPPKGKKKRNSRKLLGWMRLKRNRKGQKQRKAGWGRVRSEILTPTSSVAAVTGKPPRRAL